MMINIIRSELLRLVSSRVFVGFAVITAALGCLTGISASHVSAELNQSDWELAHETHEVELENWRSQMLNHEEACDAGERWACEMLQENSGPVVEDYLRTVVPFSDQVQATTLGLAIFMLGVVSVFVSLYIGSQFSSGGISTQLTFTPARQQVLWSKVLVGTLAAGALSLLGLGLGVMMDMLSYMWLQGVTAIGINGSPGLQFVRYLTAAMLAGALCALLAVIFSSSWKGLIACALVLYGPLILFAPFGYSLLPDAILPHRYISAVIFGSYPIGADLSDSAEIDDPFMVIHDSATTYWGGLTYCLLVLGLLALLASWLFQRRDMLK
ncbi:hypothetical protein EII34_09770 [Arachnia propionica]|uniref:ABC transporter permease n=1 Tax=Arachnia propionica TaxID=1750 RepID=A0A3P1T4Z7_9ACTN|nr:hypothetical protein [Arachnia propionica]RRD04582.1 hypothetical protein EII34_09770 [Arachnia propionica]